MADLFNSTCSYKDSPEISQASTMDSFNITEPIFGKEGLLEFSKTLSSSFDGMNLNVLPQSERSSLSLTLLILGLCLLPLTWKIIYNLFFSPLRNIPGPFLAKITSKWLTLNEVSGNRSLVVSQAHAKYGPVVRLAPDELSFSELSCVKELYMSGSKFPKSRRYDGFAASTRASFDMTDKDEHRERRNLVRHVLAQTNIDAAEPIIADQIRKALPWLRRSEGGSMEIMLWMRRIMLDTAGALFLGRSFLALENEKPPSFLDDMDDYFNITAIRWLCPWVLYILPLIPSKKVHHFLHAQERSYLYGRKAFDDYIHQYGRYSGRIDLLTKMVGNPESQPMTDEQISNELGSLLVGATDTTVVVATWMLWELAARPDWQAKIRAELRANNIAFRDGVPAYQDIKSLPILDAFVLESMRMHPAQAIGLPRIARTSTAVVGGVAIPAGTYLSIQSRQIHRNPAVFPDPDAFIPERWIETQGGTKAMKDSFLIWSKGSRACLGQYVATMELKFVVAVVCNSWDVGRGAKSLANDCADMKQTDYFLAFPKARECWLDFRGRDEAQKLAVRAKQE